MLKDTSLTPVEVAERLHIAKNTVYELIKRGELAAYRVGRKVRIDPDAVEDYKKGKKCINDSPLSFDKIHTDQEDKDADGKFIICGQDILLDILSRYLERHMPNIRALRSYVGSYEGLFALYHGNAQIATSHLWDGDSDTYNIPYVRRLLPGTPSIIYHIADRMQGFYVAKGNPKKINDWMDLSRKGITMINREKGSGTRVLLDEKLRKLHISSVSVEGYFKEEFSHIAVASTVSRGDADVGLGSEKAALQVENVDFIPLKKEQYDLVIKKEDINKPPFKMVIEILNSKEFKSELTGMGGYDLSEIGKVIAEL